MHEPLHVNAIGVRYILAAAAVTLTPALYKTPEKGFISPVVPAQGHTAGEDSDPGSLDFRVCAFPIPPSPTDGPF